MDEGTPLVGLGMGHLTSNSSPPPFLLGGTSLSRRLPFLTPPSLVGNSRILQFPPNANRSSRPRWQCDWSTEVRRRQHL